MEPRTIRDRLLALKGKKLSIGTSDDHYLSGVLQEVDGAQATFSVAGETVVVATKLIVNVREAPSLQAEYVK